MKIKIFSFLLGFTATISQVVLLREMVIVFYGNETAYAIILASWLFWISVGSFVASRIFHKIKNYLKAILILEWMVIFLFTLSILCVRSLKYASIVKGI